MCLQKRLQYAAMLISLVENQNSASDKGKSFGELQTDLSKSLDYLPYELLIIQLHALGFSLVALRLVHNHLSSRKQITKINESYSFWKAILFGVPQRSNLGTLVFNIFQCDFFIITDDINIANYADDSTPFVSGDTPLHAIISLKNAAEKKFEWFTNNHIKANYDKCHLLMSTLSQNTTFRCNTQEKFLHSYEWERYGYSHLFSMNWEKIFPFQEIYGDQFPISGNYAGYLAQLIFSQSPMGIEQFFLWYSHSMIFYLTHALEIA